jgi:site-specific DNA recombinase
MTAKRDTIKATTGTRAAIYCRISLDRDGKAEGVGRQEKDCPQLVRVHGLDVVEVFVDNDTSAYSGKMRPSSLVSWPHSTTRPLDQFDALVCWKQERLTRRLLEFFDVVRKGQAGGVRLLSVNDNIDTGSPMGQAIAGLFAGLAEQESANTSLQVKRAAEDRAAAGRSHRGKRPYGYARSAPRASSTSSTGRRRSSARWCATSSTVRARTLSRQA